MVRKFVTVGALVMFSKYLLGHLVPMYATLIGMVLTMRYRPYKCVYYVILCDMQTS